MEKNVRMVHRYGCSAADCANGLSSLGSEIYCVFPQTIRQGIHELVIYSQTHWREYPVLTQIDMLDRSFY